MFQLATYTSGPESCLGPFYLNLPQSKRRASCSPKAVRGRPKWLIAGVWRMCLLCQIVDCQQVIS
jgi:hypothetical protein